MRSSPAASPGPRCIEEFSRPKARPTPSPPLDAVSQWHASNRRTSLVLHSCFLCISVVVLVAAAVLRVNDSGHVAAPWSGASSMPPLCFFRTVFEIDCPGCGLTRCFVSAAHGNIRQAWAFHPVGVLLFGVVVGQVPYRLFQIARLLRGRSEISTIAWSPWLASALGALLIGQWVVRMLPV